MMASSFAASKNGISPTTTTTTTTTAESATAITATATPITNNEDDAVLPESTFIDPYDQEEARIECEREQAVHNVTIAQEQQLKLTKKQMYRKYGIIGGVVGIVILIITTIVVVLGNKSSTSCTVDNEEQLSVACDFLLMNNLCECQATTAASGTSFVGTIPTEIGLLTHLTYLHLSFNRLYGTIPSTLGQLTQLTYLALSSNTLTGTIPSTLGQLTQLTELGLHNTRLIGTIPSTLGQLTQLNILWLFSNAELTGSIPSTLCSLSGSRTIGIDCANLVCTCCEEETSSISCP